MITLNNTSLVLIGLIAIGFVLVSPTVYGAVEPHVLITMEAGQTTKPLQITDSGGTEIFAVDTFGNITPSTHHTKEFTFISSEGVVFTNLVTEVQATPKIFFRVALTNPLPVTNDNFQIHSIFSQVDLKRDSGSGGCKWGWSNSLNGGNTWSQFEGNTESNNVTFKQEQDFATTFTGVEGTTTDIAYVVYNSDGATVCSFKDHYAFVELILTDGMTATEVTP